jgi:protocatechuate 3,4-dioxygenase, alpha subunit
MSDVADLVALPAQTIGPFFHVGPGATHDLGRMAGPDVPGEHIELAIRLVDGDGAPVPDALVELWQADATGRYSSPAPPGPAPAFSGFGRLGTDGDGWCRFQTIRPGRLAAASGPPPAAHVNVCIHARGLLRHLYTRLYFDGDSGLDTDPVLTLVPGERRATLLAHRASTDRPWEITIRLQGADETIFFDL